MVTMFSKGSPLFSPFTLLALAASLNLPALAQDTPAEMPAEAPKANAEPAAAPAGDELPPLREWSKQKRVIRGVGPRRAMGAEASDDIIFDTSPRLRVVTAKRAERPQRLLLTDYLPPVVAQGQQNSCVGWSAGYYSYTYQVAKGRKLSPEQMQDPRFHFSPSYIYHQGNSGKDNGMQVGRGFQLLRDYGCASLAEMPYNETDFTSPPPEAARNRAKKFKAPIVAHLFRGKFVGGTAADPEKLKTFLADTKLPFVMAIPIFSDFPNGEVTSDYVYDVTVDTKNRENFYGLHAVTVMGYDEDLKAFRMVNSWGPNWGDKGFIWLSEEFVKNYGVEGWSSKPGGPIARTPEWKNVTVEPPLKEMAEGTTN